ncbi:MAG TPA: hypothetical protein GX510_02145 [Firmicutes bacterium]|nr:hypothetical protein [Candidatus Fermentithermobacillaceae bacterium]
MPERGRLAPHEMHELHEILGMETSGLKKLDAMKDEVTDAELRRVMDECLSKKREHIQQAVNLLRQTGITT